jgi:hypothetical protein
VRNVVVLVRETVAEAFRDAKRGGGGLNHPFAGLPAEGLVEGITYLSCRILFSLIVQNTKIYFPYMKIPLITY